MKISFKLFDAQMPLLALIVALFCACTWTYVYAEQGLPCSEDIAKYCKDVTPCEGRIIDCLKENKSKLSDECKGKIEESQKRLEDAMRGCAADVEKFCKDVKPGGGRISKCLREHECELSSECKEKCDAVKEKTMEKKK